MPYPNLQQYHDAYNNIRQGRGRYTAFTDPNDNGLDSVATVVRQFQQRNGAPRSSPNLKASRDASGTYDPVGIRLPQATGGRTQTSLQRGLEQFSQQQRGQQSPYGQAAPGYGSSVPQGSDDPQGMVGKIGGFLRRPGVARDLGGALTSLGAGMAAESSRPGGSALAGFASGAQMATQSLARSREEARLEEERAEKVRREQAARDAILGDERLTDADRNLLITMVESGDLAGALDRRDRIVDVAGLTARMEGMEGLNETDKSTARSLARYDLGAANQFLEGKTDESAFNDWRQRHIDTNFGLGDEVPQVLSETENEWLPLVPMELQSSFIMDRLADAKMRPSVREGLKVRYFGSDPSVVLTDADNEMLDGLVEDLEVGTAMLASPRPNISSVEAADGSVKVYRDGILIETLPPGVSRDVPPGLIESLPALKDFSDNFYSDQVEYLAARTDLNKKLAAATPETFRRLNTLGYDLLALMERGGTDAVISEAQADFLQVLNTIGFQNLSLFVGPTSDFEAGLAQMIQGNLTLSRERLQELASRQLRQRLNLWARHNDRVERAAARLPQGSFLRGEAEAHYIKLMAEDVPGFTLDEWQREMGDRSGAGGGSRILFEGKFPVTGAQIERSESDAFDPLDPFRSRIGGTAGDYWDLSGGTLVGDVSGGGTAQGTGGPVNQMRYPWSTLPSGGGISGGEVPDFRNRELFPPGQGLLFQGRQ